MKVIAKSKGQYKGVMHLVGDIFEFDEKDSQNPRASWMGDAPAPVVKTSPVAEAEKPEKPTWPKSTEHFPKGE